MIIAVEFPITDGPILTTLRTGLTADWSTGLTVQRELPATKTKRMVTLRDDGGPQQGVRSLRRQGINVWADTYEDAQQIALDSMRILRASPDGDPITAFDSFSGPFEIPDEPAYVVGDKDLTHFYFTCRAVVRGSAV